MLKKHWRRVIMFLYAMKRVVEQRTYKGPFRVVSKHAKFFTLDLGNRIDTVSVDRLKAANLLENLTDDDCMDC